jgi:hypothetical protein
MIVNAYTVYCRALKEAGVPKKRILSQFEFQKAIACVGLDQSK